MPLNKETKPSDHIWIMERYVRPSRFKTGLIYSWKPSSWRLRLHQTINGNFCYMIHGSVATHILFFLSHWEKI